MFVVSEDKTIECTRGDCGIFTVGALCDGEAHTFQVGDVIRFMVFGKKNCENVVLKKDFHVAEAATAVPIVLESKDTKFGEIINKPVTYWYSIELNPDTAQRTIIGYDQNGAKLFILYPEGRDSEV